MILFFFFRIFKYKKKTATRTMELIRTNKNVSIKIIILLACMMCVANGMFIIERRPSPFQLHLNRQAHRNHHNRHVGKSKGGRFNLMICLERCGAKLKMCVHNEATNNNVQEMILCFQANHVCREECMLRMEKHELKRQLRLRQERLAKERMARKGMHQKVVVG